jgi:hypothetical protein
MPTRSYLSQSELVVSFGLGDATRVDTIRIVWPDGEEQELAGLDVDQLLVIEQATDYSTQP